MRVLFFAVLLFSFVQVRAQKIYKELCVIDGGSLQYLDYAIDPATGDSTVEVALGKFGPLTLRYPVIGKEYAWGRPWFKNTEVITVNGRPFKAAGNMFEVDVWEVEKYDNYNGVGVYAQAPLEYTTNIFIPVMRGCLFQRYVELRLLTSRTVYYDTGWQVTTKTNAAYYRKYQVDNHDKVTGQVNDYLMNGKLQFTGYVSYMDPKDNNKDILEGVCTWYYPSGYKQVQLVMQHGKKNGIYRVWREDGSLQEWRGYKNDLLNGYHIVYGTDGRPEKMQHYTEGKADN